MRNLMVLLCFASLAIGQNLDVRHFDIKNDISVARPAVQPLRWYSGESVILDLQVMRDKSPVDLSGAGLIARWEAFAIGDDETAYIFDTGTIEDGVNGKIKFDLTPEQANLPANKYRSFVVIYQMVGDEQRHVGQVFASEVQIIFRPNEQVVFAGPYTNSVESDPHYTAVADKLVHNIIHGGVGATGSIERVGADVTITFPSGAGAGLQESSMFTSYTNAGGTFSTGQTICQSDVLSKGYANVSYDVSGSMFVVVEMSYDGNEWITAEKTPEPVMVRLLTAGGIGDTVTISNIIVSSWTRPDLFGNRFEILTQKLIVDNPAESGQAVNMSYVDGRINSVKPDEWSRYKAVTNVFLDGNRLVLGHGWSMTQAGDYGVLSFGEYAGNSKGLTISHDDALILSAESGLTGVGIVNAEIVADDMVLTVTTNYQNYLLTLQFTEDLLAPAWQAVPYTAVTNEYIVMTTPLPIQDHGYFRVVAQTGVAKLIAHVTLDMDGNKINSSHMAVAPNDVPNFGTVRNMVEPLEHGTLTLGLLYAGEEAVWTAPFLNGVTITNLYLACQIGAPTGSVLIADWDTALDANNFSLTVGANGTPSNRAVNLVVGAGQRVGLWMETGTNIIMGASW